MDFDAGASSTGDGHSENGSKAMSQDSDPKSSMASGNRIDLASEPSSTGTKVEPGEQVQFDSVHKAILKARSKKEKEAIGACCMASAEGKLDDVIHLLSQSHNSRIDAGDYDRRTSLHLAASEGHSHVVSWLIANGADVGVRDRFGNTPLHDAMRHKHNVVLGILRDAGSTFDCDEHDAASMLCQAAYQGDIDEIQRLMDNRIDPNLGDYDGRRAMHLAASEGHVKVIEYLLSRHAEVNVIDRMGGTPLADAIRNQHDAAIKLLQKHGGRMNHDDNAASELCRIAALGNVEEMRRYVENGMDVNIGDYDSRRPLHLACCEGNLGMVQCRNQI